jgi:hypothetical protein
MNRAVMDEVKPYYECQAKVGEVPINHGRLLLDCFSSNHIGCCGPFKRVIVLVYHGGGMVVVARPQDDDTTIDCLAARAEDRWHTDQGCGTRQHKADQPPWS